MSNLVCSKCGSTRIMTERNPNGFHYCIFCNHRWKIGEKPTVFDRITASPEAPAGEGNRDLKKPECPFCYVSHNSPDCSVVGRDGSKEICNKALYCGFYPHRVFCKPGNCKKHIKAYLDKRIERSAKRLFEAAVLNVKKEGF